MLFVLMITFTCLFNGQILSINCPVDKPLTPCFTAPCDARPSCGNYPMATCYNNYCGECRADFYMFGQLVNCTGVDSSPSKSCPDGTYPSCMIPPCLEAECPAYPSAVCKNVLCPECQAKFYLGDMIMNCKTKPKNDILEKIKEFIGQFDYVWEKIKQFFKLF